MHLRGSASGAADRGANRVRAARRKFGRLIGIGSHLRAVQMRSSMCLAGLASHTRPGASVNRDAHAAHPRPAAHLIVSTGVSAHQRPALVINSTTAHELPAGRPQAGRLAKFSPKQTRPAKWISIWPLAALTSLHLQPARHAHAQQVATLLASQVVILFLLHFSGSAGQKVSPWRLAVWPGSLASVERRAPVGPGAQLARLQILCACAG